MNRRDALTTSAAVLAGLATALPAAAQSSDDETQANFETVMTFMGAMGGGDMAAMDALMADDMVWHNEGDTSLPWIGVWEGKEAIFGFLGTFSTETQVTLWENLEAFASGDTVAAFGRMKMRMTASGAETDTFTFGLRAKASGGKVTLWNWLEDSYAVSKAFHGA